MTVGDRGRAPLTDRALLAGSLATASTFVLSAVAASARLWDPLDRAVLLWVQSFASFPLDVVSSALSALGGLPITITAAIVLSLVWTARDGLRGATPFAIVVVMVAGLIAQRLVSQPGPPIETLRDFHWLALSVGDSLSAQAFPSGHVARTTFIALSFAKRHPRTAPLMWALIAAMAASRAYGGSHWASDVIGGVLLGTSVALGAIAVAARRSARISG